MSIFRSLDVTLLNLRAGKYWHRHRRPRPVTYNSSLEYHKGLLRAEEQQKSAAKRKRPVAVVEEKHQPVDDDVEMDTPGPSKPKSLPETPAPMIDTAPDRAMSPVSTASSTSESPLAHRVKMNGNAHSKSAPPAPAEPEADANEPSAMSPPQASPPRPTPSVPPPAQSSPVGVDNLLPRVRYADRDNVIGSDADGNPPVADGRDHQHEDEVF